MTRLGLGIIGCGFIAQQVHLQTLKNFPDLEVIAVADSDPDRRLEAGFACPGAMAVATYQELLDVPEIEAVLICLPTTLHAEVAIAALHSGKHVYLEKPIANNCSEARTLVKVWQRTNLIGMIGYNYRFHPLYIDAKKRLPANEIGRPLCVRTVFSAPLQQVQEWKNQRRTGGGALLELASHHIDLIRFLFDQEISGVFSMSQSHSSDQDSVLLELLLESGPSVQSFFSVSSVEEDRMEIYGDQGKLSLDRHLSAGVERIGIHPDLSRAGWTARQIRNLVSNPYLVRKTLQPRKEPSYMEAMRAFLATVRGKRIPIPTFLDGWRTLTVIEAAEESCRTGTLTAPDDVI